MSNVLEIAIDNQEFVLVIELWMMRVS